MIWLVILVIALVIVPLYDGHLDRKQNRNWSAMKARGETRLPNTTKYSGYIVDYDRDWVRDKKLYPKELVPILEKDPQARKLFAEIKVAQKQWREGDGPATIGGVVDPEIRKLNRNPDLQYAAFMHKYAPDVKISEEK